MLRTGTSDKENIFEAMAVRIREFKIGKLIKKHQIFEALLLQLEYPTIFSLWKKPYYIFEIWL